MYSSCPQRFQKVLTRFPLELSKFLFDCSDVPGSDLELVLHNVPQTFPSTFLLNGFKLFQGLLAVNIKVPPRFL